jgi:hypothetical protein
MSLVGTFSLKETCSFKEAPMTAQINDRFLHRGLEYSLAGISEGEVLDLTLLGVEPMGTCSACWRGYQAVFAVAESRLVLDALLINLMGPGKGKSRSVGGPEINGVGPVPRKKEGYDLFSHHYLGLNYHLEYSGGLLLADGFIDSLYVHMGFHPPWKYEMVVELVFEGGVLHAEYDRSERMAEVRAMMTKTDGDDVSSDRPNMIEIRRFVERAFDRSYRM